MSTPVAGRKKDSVIIEQIIIIVLLVGIATFGILSAYRYITMEPVISPQDLEIKKLSKLLEQRPSDKDLRLLLAYNYQKAKDYDNATKLYNEVLKTDPKELAALYNLGVIAQDHKQYAEAEKIYRKVLELKKTHVLGAIGFSEVCIAQGKFDDAIKALEEPIKLKGSIVRLRLLKAQALEGKGDKNGAKREYNEILKYVPDHEEALKALKRLK